LQNTKESQRIAQEQVPLLQRFQCTKYLNSCKLAWHSIDNNREKVTWTRYSARADRAGFDGKATHLNMRKQAYFSPRRNVRLPKKPCFAPILTFKPHL
jgi:hypothetical protein